MQVPNKLPAGLHTGAGSHLRKPSNHASCGEDLWLQDFKVWRVRWVQCKFVQTVSIEYRSLLIEWITNITAVVIFAYI